MSERRGTKALELWCRRITEGYPGVNVQNMTTSWKDGLAFCAMIHHFRPDLIDFDGLDKNNVYKNNELAFRIAEQHLGIPALLDAEDMASCSVPDRLSILTYLSQFYQTFGGSSPVRHPSSRTTETVEERIPQVPESPKEKETSYPAMRKDLCAVCGLPIFLAEKLVLARVAYHRTCFRCARCNNQLTLGNYYETEEGQYCCETCPDEEIPPSTMQNWNDSLTVSGTEKDEVNVSSKTSVNNDESVNEVMPTYNSAKIFDHKDCHIPDLIAQTSRLRLNFISNQMLSEQEDKSQTDENLNGFEEDRTNINLIPPISREYRQQKVEEEGYDSIADSLQLEADSTKSTVESASGNFENVNDQFQNQVNTNIHSRNEELSVASSSDIVKDKLVFRNDIKELMSRGDQSTCTESSSSLVQQRRRLFEKPSNYSVKDQSNGNNTEVLKPKIEKLKVDKKEHETVGNIKNLMKDSDTEKVVDDQKDTLKNNFENFNVTLQNVSSDVVPLDTRRTLKHLSVTVPQKSSEDQEYTDSTNATIATSISGNLHEDYPEDLNPFKSDEEEEMIDKSRDSTNPFGNEDEEEEGEEVEKKEIVPPKPAVRNNFNSPKGNEKLITEGPTKRLLAAPQINLNPFWSDDDDHDSDLESRGKASGITPVPKPRTVKCNQDQDTFMHGPKSNQSYDSLQISNSSLRSSESGISVGGTYKKKKPAPLPPNKKDPPAHSTPKTRKTKPAPPPPVPTTSNLEQSPISKTQNENKEHNMWEDQKINKDETNRNRQSFTHVSCDENLHYRTYLDKSVEGKWKRKKGPAPACPIPHRRKIKVMSLKDVKLELDEIELQQQGLEKQGVRLEQLIRSKCESGSRINDTSLAIDVEELVLELFALVNEKNELFRRQAELMLLRRQQRLEEEHAEIEYQIRCLMSQHESTKTDFDKQREEALIHRLVEIVEKRNEIVDCLEMDRRREIEEDRSIHRHMDLFAAKNKSESSNNEMDTAEKKKRKQSKIKEKAKEKKLKKTLKKDIDKDVDEIELTLKRHTKRKWF